MSTSLCISNIFFISLTIFIFIHFHFQICTLHFILFCLHILSVYIFTKLSNSILLFQLTIFLLLNTYSFHPLTWLTVFTFKFFSLLFFFFIFILASCQDPNTKSSPLQSNGSAICYLLFILGFILYYPPYYSLPTSFHSIPIHLLISPSYQHHYTWIIKYQL